MNAWKAAAQPDRPLLITFLCSLLFFALLASTLSFPQTLPVDAARYGDWIWFYSVGGVLAALIGVVGLWFMQSWAPYMMTVALIAELATALSNNLSLTGLPMLLQIAIIVIGLMYRQHME